MRKISLIGLGLIGSSMARDIKAIYPDDHLIAYDSNPEVRARVQELGLVDLMTDRLEEALKAGDIVILCIPPSEIVTHADKIARALKPGAILSDVSSVKRSVIEAISAHLPESVHFVPAHPVSGTENSGPDAGHRDLFRDRWCIITPVDRTCPEKVATIRTLWEDLGSEVEQMTPEHHDIVLAVTSHIPHLIAYTIVGTANDLESVTRSEVIKYSAGGFRDFTRIAASDPTMWRDIFLNNKDAVLEVLQRFSEDLTALQRAIRWGDGATLFDLFTRTRAIRRSVIAAHQDTELDNFGRDQLSDPQPKSKP